MEPVRFISNFSTGNRGAGLCEQFLRLNYFVVFLSARRGVQPFVRHLLPQNPSPELLDCVSFSPGESVVFNVDCSKGQGDNSSIRWA